MNVNASQIENALYDAYGPRWVSTIYGSVNEYKVLLELEPKFQQDPRALSLLYFKNGAGKLIPLDIKTGDRVLFGKWSGTEVKIDGEDLLIMKESDILGIVEETGKLRKAA